MTPDHRPQVAAQRRERMRARLVHAAFSIAAQSGFGAVTIDAVIAQADVARGSFYKYFDSTQALMEAVGKDVSDALLETMHPVVSLLEDPAQRIAAGVRLVLQMGQLHPRLAGFLVRSGWPAADLSPMFHAVVGATLRSGMAQGRFADMAPELAHSIVVGSMVGALHAYSGQGAAETLPQQAAAAVLRGLGLPAKEAARIAAQKLPLAATDMAAALAKLSDIKTHQYQPAPISKER